MTSIAPPGGAGTMMRTGLVGKACARSAPDPAAMQAITAKLTSVRRIDIDAFWVGQTRAAGKIESGVDLWVGFAAGWVRGGLGQERKTRPAITPVISPFS